MPVLIHRGHPVYESQDQIVYLAEHAGERGATLLGETAAKRREVERWVDRASIVGDPMEGSEQRAGHCIPGLVIPLFAAMVQYIPYREIVQGLWTHPDKKRPLLFMLMKARDQQGTVKLGMAASIIRRCRDDMAAHLDALEQQLAGHGCDWILGEDFTLADASWAVLLDRLVEVDWQAYYWGYEQRPAVSAYWQRLCARPSYQRQVEERRCAITRKGIADVAEMKAALPGYRLTLEGD